MMLKPIKHNAHMYTPKEIYFTFIEKWHGTQPQYIQYVQSQWGKTMDKWAVGIHDVPIQGIHTNGFIKSWH